MFENHYRCRPDYDILKSPANLIELLIGALYKYGYWREAVRWIVAVFRPLALAAVDACRDIMYVNFAPDDNHMSAPQRLYDTDDIIKGYKAFIPYPCPAQETLPGRL